MKHVNPPKHFADIGAIRRMARKINALLKIKIFNEYGEECGEASFADDNTFLIISGLGSRWQKPYKELDPDRAVAKGTWVYISPSNPIVTAGMTDPIAGAGTKAYPGIWEAAKDVPASTGVDDYNVPQTDYPGATGTPTGTTPNYKGDLDGADVYWILICPTCGL